MVVNLTLICSIRNNILGRVEYISPSSLGEGEMILILSISRPVSLMSLESPLRNHRCQGVPPASPSSHSSLPFGPLIPNLRLSISSILLFCFSLFPKCVLCQTVVTVTVAATDTSAIAYAPPLNDTSAWATFANGSLAGVLAQSNHSVMTFEFQGECVLAMEVYSMWICGYVDLISVIHLTKVHRSRCSETLSSSTSIVYS